MPANTILVCCMRSTAHGPVGAAPHGSFTRELTPLRKPRSHGVEECILRGRAALTVVADTLGAAVCDNVDKIELVKARV